MYSVTGDGAAPTYFAVNDTTGEITVKEPLADTEIEFFYVSISCY